MDVARVSNGDPSAGGPASCRDLSCGDDQSSREKAHGSAGRIPGRNRTLSQGRSGIPQPASSARALQHREPALEHARS